MFGIPLFTLLALAFIGWRVYAYFKKKSTSELELEKSLEDERIYVEGVGDVRVEELGEDDITAKP